MEYTPTLWKDGDIITAASLNHLEQGVAEGQGGVSSFNGRDGAVIPQAGDYTAADVGARPSDWMPTADDVGALPDTTYIPSKISDLTNDSNFVTTSQMNTAIQAAILDSWEASY